MKITSMLSANFHFDPTQVRMITVTQQQTQNARFFLNGVSAKPMPVSGDAAAFIAALVNAGDFVQFHFAANLHPFWVNAKHVRAVHEPSTTNSAHVPNTNAIIFIGAKGRFVNETVDITVNLIKAAGGNI